MSRIGEIFSQLRSRNEAALVAFLVAGDPDEERSLAFLEAVAEGGADVLEVGLPFSDPLADGKVIQEGCQRALAANTTTTKVLEMVRRLRSRHEVGVVLFSCYNLLLQYGLESFAEDAVAAGADGVIVTDLPPEEASEWHKIARTAGLDTIFLVAPTKDSAHISKILELSSGFVYAISRLGVTGARAELPADLPDFINRIKSLTDLPVAVGFGISTSEQVKEICRLADGAVIGTALVKKTTTGSAEEVREFVGTLKAATKNAEKSSGP